MLTMLSPAAKLPHKARKKACPGKLRTRRPAQIAARSRSSGATMNNKQQALPKITPIPGQGSETRAFDHLKAGRLAGAAMDLCYPLPVSMTDPILDAPRTVLTPHMAWQTRETFRRAATMSVENILNYFRGEPSHVANPDALQVPRPRLQPSR